MCFAGSDDPVDRVRRNARVLQDFSRGFRGQRYFRFVGVRMCQRNDSGTMAQLPGWHAKGRVNLFRWNGSRAERDAGESQQSRGGHEKFAPFF